MVWVAGTQVQHGQYTIEKVLGHGRFGVTYLARDRQQDPVVIKTPNDEALSQPDFDRLQQVFVQEAVKLAQCHHPHIVRTEAPFQEKGCWCLVMEYIDGVTLAERAQRVLPEADAIAYIQQIGAALTEVHRNGLLHRDVRPHNIMVRAGKAEAVLIDFGLALDFDHEITVTRTEEITEGYAPLELYTRQAKRGAYTDVYALGATLYTLLTGKVPVGAKQRKLSQQRLEPPQAVNPQVSDRVSRAVMWAMELEASDRPASVSQWLESLESRLKPGNVPSSGNNSPAGLSLQVWSLIIAGIAALGGLLGGMAGWIPMFKTQPLPTPTVSPSPSSPASPSPTASSSPTASPAPKPTAPSPTASPSPAGGTTP